MIICQLCGYENDDGDQFCGNCPGYLAHVGQQVDEPEPEMTYEEEPAQDSRSGLVSRVKAAVAGKPNDGVPTEGSTVVDTPTAEASPPEAQPAEPAASAQPAPAETPAPTPAGAPAPGADQETTITPESAAPVRPVPDVDEQAAERARRAAALVAKPPPPAAETAARQPTAQPPAPPRPRRPPRKATPTRKVDPGDLVCGECGEPNTPARKFCRRCAASLEEAQVAKVRWWRKIRRPGAKQVAAGARRGRGAGGRPLQRLGRGVKRWLRRFAVVAVLIAMLGALGPWRAPVMDWGRGTYQSLRQRVAPELVTVNPVGIRPASGSSAHPEHPAENAILQEDNTHWTAGAEGPGQVLVVTFAEPVDLRSVGFRSGASGDAFLRHPRPFDVHLVFDSGSSADLELTDTREFQDHRVDASNVREIEIHIRSLHPVREGESNAVAITNVQFTALKESVGSEE